MPASLISPSVISTRMARAQGFGDRLGIHMGDHKHLVGARFDGHGGDEPVGIEFRREDTARFEFGFGKGLGIGELCHGAVFN